MYADGSTFHGIWRDGKKHGVGVFKPASKEKDKDRAKAVMKSNSGRALGSAVDGDSVSNLNAYESSQQADMPIQSGWRDAMTDGLPPADGHTWVYMLPGKSASKG